MDAAGNKTCYYYDKLHRMNGGGYNTVCRQFYYDATVTPPSGITVTNTKTRLLEASTSNCSSTRYTDEWFSYDKDGRLTDVYESTPNSGGYYHTTAGYWPTGALETLRLLNSSGAALIPTQTYGVDAEGRINAVTASGQSPVTTVSYSPGNSNGPLGAVLGVTFGSGDSDAFTYSPNTGRLATYTFSVNGKTDVGTLTWSANGTLSKLVINDQIPGTADSETCTYGYDDIRRVSGVACGAFWVQNFTYDAFGNLSKNVPPGDGGLTFLPSYWSSPPTNQFSSLPGATVSYDGNGNLLTDNLNTYTWDPNWGTMTTVSTGATTVTSTYDALGRMVENNAGGTYAQFVYGPTGRIAKTNGQTLVKAFVSLPGGAKAIYNASGLAYYRHSDWLGSSRLTSTAASPTAMYSSSAYAPFGEQYKTSGSADASFTGQDQDTVSNLYDFPARRQSPSQGRWISPDPAGGGAVTLTNPQSWNRYAYVNNNPMSLIDPMGMSTKRRHVHRMEDDNCEDDCGDGGDGGGDGGGGGGSGDGSGDGGDDPSDPCAQDPSLCYAPPGQGPDLGPDNPVMPTSPCAEGLADAHADIGAVDRANAMWGTIQAAADAHNIDPALLAAVGIEETGFRNVWQGCTTDPSCANADGAGIWQIDLGPNGGNPNVSVQQAFDPTWAADYSANKLSNNMNTLAAKFPNFTPDQLTQATAASYNFGTGNISGNPATIDVGTQPDSNYGATVLALMDCF